MTNDESIRADFLQIAQNWRNLARSYQFAESMERFLLQRTAANRSPDLQE